MTTPFFTIILPTYNRAGIIVRAIESVLCQRFDEWELIVLDDGSTDNTGAVVKSFEDERIKYIFQENQERSVARNTGIANAKGQYICFLDSDDYYLENHLETFYQRIKSRDFPIAIFFCNTYQELNGELLKIPPPEHLRENNIEFFLLNTIGVPRSCIHSRILDKYKFNPEYRIGEDTELWVRIVNEFPYYYNNDYTEVFLTHDGRTVDTGDEKIILEDLEGKKKILKSLGKMITPNIGRKILGYYYLKLARFYVKQDRNCMLLNAVSKSLAYDPMCNVKEKIFLLKSSFGVSRFFEHQKIMI